MNKMSDAQRRKIFKLAGERGLDGELLHAYIHHLTGKDSLKELSIKDAIKVIDSLEGKKQNADNMITDKQKKFIEGLAKDIGWVDENKNLEPSRLNSFIHSKYGISHINWLTVQKAAEVIEGLKAIRSRAQEAI